MNTIFSGGQLSCHVLVYLHRLWIWLCSDKAAFLKSCHLSWALWFVDPDILLNKEDVNCVLNVRAHLHWYWNMSAKRVHFFYCHGKEMSDSIWTNPSTRCYWSPNHGTLTMRLSRGLRGIRILLLSIIKKTLVCSTQRCAVLCGEHDVAMSTHFDWLRCWVCAVNGCSGSFVQVTGHYLSPRINLGRSIVFLYNCKGGQLCIDR